MEKNHKTSQVNEGTANWRQTWATACTAQVGCGYCGNSRLYVPLNGDPSCSSRTH